MNLDDLAAAKQLDSLNMLAEIDNLPDQLARAWVHAQNLPLPQVSAISRVILCGVGGASSGAELLAGYADSQCPVPVLVHHDYNLPAWVTGKDTLVIAISHTGNSEETLTAFDEAIRRGCSLLAISTGGKLAKKAAAAGCPVWLYQFKGQSRAAIGFSFGYLLAAFTRLGLLPAQDELIAGALAAMQTQQKTITIDIPAAQNPAKRYAGQLVGRWVTIYGSGFLAPVARRWKCQINQNAKAPANYEYLPEGNHNTLAGVINPSAELLMPHTMTLFLNAANDLPRNRFRTMITRQTYMVEGLNTDIYMATGESRLGQMWTAVHFGDYLSYYLAIAYATDPTPVEVLSTLEAALASQK